MNDIATMTRDPLRVTGKGGKTHLFTVRPGETSTTFELMATHVGHKVAARFTGGCKGMNSADKTDMIAYALAAYGGYKGLLFSGATRTIGKDGELDPMVTDLPVFISQDAGNDGSVALGTVPLTDIPTLQGRSQLVLDEWGTRPNPGMGGILMVQKGPDDFFDWDGDLANYFQMLDRLVNFGGFEGVHVLAWNGGPITRTEVMMAARRKDWPVFLVNGTGRVAEELATAVLAGDYSAFEEAGVPEQNFGNIHVVPKDDPMVLRGYLLRLGFIQLEAAARYDALHS